jgi:Na+-translocating ferredoxin:NAD+ oxidoreductase RnfC subunit
VGIDPEEIAGVLVGGVMMGSLMQSLDQVVTRTTGGLLCFPEGHRLVERYRADSRRRSRIGKAACDQCSFCTELCPRWLLGHPIEPHRAMRSLGFNQIGEANVIGTQFCCECNLCSLYSCPEDLDPKNVCTQNKRRLASEKRRWENPPFVPSRPGLHLENRKAPIPRLMQKLGLTAFVNKGPLEGDLLKADRVGIRLKQHVGAPCAPAVSEGDRVRKGQPVGAVPVSNGKPALGAPVHASLDGVVAEVSDGVVWIQRESV